MKIYDLKEIFKNLVDKDRVGINKDHDIQIVRKCVSDVKFIYIFNKKSKDYCLDRDFLNLVSYIVWSGKCLFARSYR